MESIPAKTTSRGSPASGSESDHVTSRWAVSASPKQRQTCHGKAEAKTDLSQRSRSEDGSLSSVLGLRSLKLEFQTPQSHFSMKQLAI